MIQKYLEKIKELEEENENLYNKLERLAAEISRLHLASAVNTSFDGERMVKAKKKLLYEKDKHLAKIKANTAIIKTNVKLITTSEEFINKISCVDNKSERVDKLNIERGELKQIYERNASRKTILKMRENTLSDNERRELEVRKNSDKALFEQIKELDRLIEDITRPISENIELLDIIKKYMSEEEVENNCEEVCSDCMYKNWTFYNTCADPCRECDAHGTAINKKTGTDNRVRVTIEKNSFSLLISNIVNLALDSEYTDMYFNSYYETDAGPRYEYVGSNSKYERILVTTDESFEIYSKDSSYMTEEEALKHIWIECMVDDHIHD